MFGYKYNDASDGNSEDERHYKGWCKEHFSLYEHPEGTDIADYKNSTDEEKSVTIQITYAIAK